MSSNTKIVAAFLVGMGLCALTARSSTKSPARDDHGVFTGDVKVVFYVQNVRRAVEFYTGALGFTFHHYYDHISGGSVETWTHEEAPIYAEMSFAGRRFGLHAPTSEADRKSVGAAKIYFRVKDLEAHHRRTSARGAHPSEIQHLSWMDMFRVVDADGNRIYFAFTDDKIHGNPWFGKK